MLSHTYNGRICTRVVFGRRGRLPGTKIPDSIGHGSSSKPSDGLRTKFPKYDYADMVDAQYRLLTEGLGMHHVRLIIGNSMGGNPGDLAFRADFRFVSKADIPAS